MMNASTKSSVIHFYDDELDQELNDGIERFEQHNIRFRTPNRSIGPKHKHKHFNQEREWS